MFLWLLITAGSDVTNINRWNPKEKHKRDNIEQAAGYSGTGNLGTRRCGAATLSPASWSRGARPGVCRWDHSERGASCKGPRVQECLSLSLLVSSRRLLAGLVRLTALGGKTDSRR